MNSTEEFKPTSTAECSGLQPGHFPVALQADHVWKKLMFADGRDNTGLCGLWLKSLTRRFGAETIRTVLNDNWAGMDSASRRNVCYAASNADAMPTDWVVELFEHPKSEVHERRLLISALLMSDNKRKIGWKLSDLAHRVGTCESEAEQIVVNRLIQKIDNHLQKMYPKFLGARW